LTQSDVAIALLKQLASCLAMPMFVLGPEGELLFFNESTEPILGLRFEETGSMPVDEWLELIQTTNEEGIPVKQEHRPLIAALQRRESTNSRFWLRGLDGQHRRVEATAVPLVDLEGRLFGALGFMWELEREGPAQRETLVPISNPEFQEVETILTRRLASKLALPIFLVDVDGRLLYVNQAAEPLLGLRFEELAGKSRDEMYETFRPSRADGSPMPPHEHPLWIARVTREPVHLPIRIKGRDGVERRLEVTAIPLVGQSGRMLGAFGLFWEGKTEAGEAL
jgi:PAS domain S-box-containing protein